MEEFTERGHLTPERVPRISIEELKALMDGGADVVIVDNQPKVAYEKQHIKGAISIPWTMKGLATESSQKLPRDKDRAIITYCDCGPGELDSADIATRLIGMGFSNVKVLADPSIRGWVEAGNPVEE